MGKELDPHHLAALMAFTFAKQQDGYRRLDPPPQHVKNGITDDLNTSLRTFSVLDAIAGISVSEEENQIVAVALQFNSQTKEIRLTIAANKTDRRKLVSHLTAVWGKLQALSNTYAERRGKEPNLSGRRSPQIPPMLALPPRIEIFRDIYQFCMGKEIKRIKKWLEGLNSFMLQLVEHRGKAGLRGSELNLHYVMAGSFTMLKLLIKLHDNPGTEFADREWKNIFMESLWVIENAIPPLKDGNYCEVLAQEIKGRRSEGPFQLRRALEKLTLLAHHADSLISFAHSPRLRPALQCAVSISIVPKHARTISLPTSREQWQSILEAACTERDSWQRETAEELLKFAPEECVCPPHPECELIQYIDVKRGSPWDHTPPFSYIGVSRPSCGACRNWITAFNGLGGLQFRIGGASGKWYWPWAMPEGPEALGKMMAQRVSSEYLSYQIRRSDLAAAASSFERASSRFNARREEIYSSYAAMEQQYGGTPLGLIEGFLSELEKRRELSSEEESDSDSAISEESVLD